MEANRLRAWWSHRQGLDGSLQGKTAVEVLERSGWARSVGGVGPYLTLFSRGGIDRKKADAAVARLQIHELPSARGCTYVVTKQDFALALKVGEGFGDGDMKAAAKLGVTDKEIRKLCNAVVKALARGTLSPEEIRDATGKASRSLGEEGKKKGLTTTLPLALGKLQAEGAIRRVPVNGRLDQQRYAYTLWRPNPLEGFGLDLAAARTELARKYFRWIGPATPAEFQWFSGLGVKDTKSALAPLNLVPLETGSDRLMFADDRDALVAFKAPREAQYALTSSLDAMCLLRRNITDLLDDRDRDHRAFGDAWARAGGGLMDLPNHAILDRGRLVGLWEYDPDSQSIAWVAFGVKDKALNAAVEATQAFIRNELEDARSFSLDSPKSRRPRIEALRKAAAQ
jgi:hypothetical protein